ncbi:hypothetical protein N7456_011715 [Penicillium angulare]|uniref:Uncharacterized protein n=1 Tax=Penicillium angulare TaxID=116970 RepID=A0A9W9EUC9_9EURO|nr:hypothetical protein N7456_011715 [Penicillium angulare]
METSLSTLTLMHMARSQKDSALAGYSKYYYNLLMKQILGLRELKGPTDLIRAGMILALYETYNPMPDQENAWPVHVKAFLRLCNTGFLAAIPSPYLRNGSSDVFDQLLEIIFQATILFHGYQRSRQNESLNLTAAEHMLTAASNYETMLLTWYGQLQCQSDQPLFMAQDHPRQPQAIIAFPNMSTIPLLLVYWLGMVVVYDSMLEALETLQVAHQSSPDEYGDFERKMKETDAIFRLYFAHITQCQAGVDTGNGLGASIMASATLSAAYQVYLRREMRKSYDNMHSSLHK